VYLLDTHALVWGVTVPEQLPVRVREILTTGEVKASVSYWELTLKKDRPRALVVHPAEWWGPIRDPRLRRSAAIRVAHVDQLDALADIHRDPFDRMLVALALAEPCTLISRDGVMARYGAPVVWQ
jgi:PIN domain nuclease of toxin-antitoxin system